MGYQEGDDKLASIVEWGVGSGEWVVCVICRHTKLLLTIYRVGYFYLFLCLLCV
jgi:hypothetical protein